MSDGRIREERFKQGRNRKIDMSIHYADHTGLVATDPEVQKSLLEIRACLANGDLLPNKYYRNGIDRDVDHMLQNYGIKHLHLHHDTNVDCLLFLVEYRDSVLFLEVDEHGKHFSKPAGSFLAQLHQSEIANTDAKAAVLAVSRVAAIKAALKPRRGGEQKGDE